MRLADLAVACADICVKPTFNFSHFCSSDFDYDLQDARVRGVYEGVISFDDPIEPKVVG
jgi:hypothetical protein